MKNGAKFEVIDAGARTFKYSVDSSLKFSGVSLPKVPSESPRYLAVRVSILSTNELEISTVAKVRRE